MNQALRNAISVTGVSATGISTANFYFHEVPEGTAYPYCIFDDVSTPITRDSATNFENTEVQFIFYSDVLTECETLANNLKAVMDYGKSNLTVSGYTVIESVLTLDLGATKPDQIWTYIMQYRITISKGR